MTYHTWRLYKAASVHSFERGNISYEQLWDLLVFAVLWRLRKRMTGDGQLFALYLGLYAIGKFAITFVRLDPVYFWGLQQSHFVALGLLALAFAWAFCGRAHQRGIGTSRFSQ